MEFALLQVGINDYPFVPLKGSVNDCLNLSRQFSHFNLATSEIVRLYDLNATRANLLESLRWLVRQDVPVLIFQYSGHGTRVRDRSGDETSHFDSAICPVDFIDAGVILDDELTDIYALVPPGKRLIILSDFKLVEIDDRALSATDTLHERLKTGFDADAIATVRNVLTDIEKARKAGAITFKSQKAAEFYFEAIASTEVTLNLIEALQSGRREPSIRAAGDRAMQRLQAGADEPRWWNRAIVKVTEIARIMTAQGALDTPTAWADGDERSAKLHAKNKALLEAWKSAGNLQE
jgi:hypothetical protein